MKHLKTIGDFADGRENNFDIIRFFAATMVLFAHSYPLSSGVQLEDPLARFSHFINFGGLGVYIFFMISGFLVTRSYCSRNDIGNFVKARVLRIFPGLIVATVFSAFIIGSFATTLPILDYFKNRDTYGYIFHNVFLYKIRYNLPGVFLNNPYPGAVNGSLWTLPVEFKMYILVATVGLMGIFKSKKYFNIFSLVIILAYFMLLSVNINLLDPVNKLMIIYFLLGAVVWINREHIPLHPAILIFICTITAVVFKTAFLNYIFPITLVYTIFFIAYYPSIKIHNFGKYGDFSYGMYIYAFPMQQLVALLIKDISPMKLFAIAFVLTLGASVLSWKLIEKPAMRYKNKKILNFIKSESVEL